MMGPNIKTPLEQGPNDTESEYEWKERILRKIKTHWNTFFKENINCKLSECVDPMTDDKITRIIAMNNLIDYRNACVQGFIKRPCTQGMRVHLHETDNITYPNFTVNTFSINFIRHRSYDHDDHDQSVQEDQQRRRTEEKTLRYF